MEAERGAITRRMEDALNGLEEKFAALCDARDFENKLTALRKAGNRSDRASKLRDLFDLFDLCGIEYERGRENEYYEALVRRSGLLSLPEVEDRMLCALFTDFRQYPTPEEYMRRIVDRLCSPEDGWEGDTLRLRILKQFIKYGDYLRGGGTDRQRMYGGEPHIKRYAGKRAGKALRDTDQVLEALDDGVFDVLETADKAQKKPGGTYGLLKMVDDLAAGKFRTEGATRKSLYLFAMVYGMTFYSGDMGGGEILDPRTDVERNLFQDYYVNNLMRFLLKAYRDGSCEYELDPSGQGINYKNFAEMVFLYYISKDMEAREKIRLSDEMIQRLENAETPGRAETASGDTRYYRDLIRNDAGDLYLENVLALPEAEFEAFIRAHYNCDPYEGTRGTKAERKKGEMQLETEQNSAFRAYQELIGLLDAEMKKKGLFRENCNYGLWFGDMSALRKKGFEGLEDEIWRRIARMLPEEKRAEAGREDFHAFLQLLFAVNSFLGRTVDESVSDQSEAQERTALSKAKTKALFLTSPETVTRTSILVAYYYYYNALHEDDESERRKCFKELFQDFKRGADGYLSRAFYQPLSGRNFFDVLLVFSTYAYLNV